MVPAPVQAQAQAHGYVLMVLVCIRVGLRFGWGCGFAAVVLCRFLQACLATLLAVGDCRVNRLRFTHIPVHDFFNLPSVIFLRLRVDPFPRTCMAGPAFQAALPTDLPCTTKLSDPCPRDMEAPWVNLHPGCSPDSTCRRTIITCNPAGLFHHRGNHHIWALMAHRFSLLPDMLPAQAFVLCGPTHPSPSTEHRLAACHQM